jgi:hypothetical protein
MPIASNLAAEAWVGTCRQVLRAKVIAIAGLVLAFGYAGVAAAAPKAEGGKPAPIIPLLLAHPTSYDVRLKLDPDGTAAEDHALGIRVISGALKNLEIKATDTAATAIGDARIQSEDGRASVAAIVVREDGTIAIAPLEEKGLKRGMYTFSFTLRTDLVKSGALKREGAFYRIAWQSAGLNDGIDGMRVVFDLPAASTEPRPIGAGDGRTNEDGLVSTLRRGPSRDELEIVRPHVSRGDAVLWEARVDPRALPAIRSKALAPRPIVATPSAALAADAPGVAEWSIVGILALIVLFCASIKEHALRTSGSKPRLPFPASVRVLGATLSAAGTGVLALGDLALEQIIFCAVGVLALYGFVARRPIPRASVKARGPGDWLALRPDEAFRSGALAGTASFLELGSSPGRLALAALIAAAVVAGWVGSKVEPHAPGFVTVTAAMLVALWSSAPNPESASRRLLARAYRRLVRIRFLKAVPWARVPRGGTTVEELRLRVVPRHPMPGLLALELGPAAEKLELLVRVRDESPAARKLSACAEIGARPERSSRAVPGRSADERVLSLEPPSPTVLAACRLVRDVSELLIERREPEPAAAVVSPASASASASASAFAAREPYAGPERRLVPA